MVSVAGFVRDWTTVVVFAMFRCHEAQSVAINSNNKKSKMVRSMNGQPSRRPGAKQKASKTESRDQQG